jgi:hypothetical protein
VEFCNQITPSVIIADNKVIVGHIGIWDGGIHPLILNCGTKQKREVIFTTLLP